MALSLLDLPNELLIEIISYLHASIDLFAIIRTSRSFWQLFQTIGPAIIRQRFGETAFGGQIGLCAAVAAFRLTWLCCDNHQRGCPDWSPCAHPLYQSFVAQDVTPVLPHEVLGFLNLMELVDKAIDFHLAHDFENKTCKRETCPDCIYEYSPSANPCLTTYSRSAQKTVAEARCHYFFYDLYYRTYLGPGILRRGMILLIKEAVKPIISWADLRHLLNNFFSVIGVRHHPLTMVHSRTTTSPILRRRPAPLHFPGVYMVLLSS